MLHQEKYVHERQIYGFIDLLGDLGGVMEVIMIVFGIILYPISFHSFKIMQFCLGTFEPIIFS